MIRYTRACYPSMRPRREYAPVKVQANVVAPEVMAATNVIAVSGRVTPLVVGLWSVHADVIMRTYRLARFFEAYSLNGRGSRYPSASVLRGN